MKTIEFQLTDQEYEKIKDKIRLHLVLENQSLKEEINQLLKEHADETNDLRDRINAMQNLIDKYEDELQMYYKYAGKERIK